ncbi:hypothetical protein [Chitinophaga sp. sic0106]|uniref:hypothetical protein n=1 Tax=Chitinophaga sp. sic0106 TaxID=2854785 RepID=UPI001C439D58|nr:hypothetical protein [Chitinophaga sp. sic0106]MBV7531018.1 hypothetical protein [Chitinophaga sp. sic0106]
MFHLIINRKKSLRAFTAGLLLALFSISQVPAQWLHGCFSSHEHSCSDGVHSEQTRLTKTQIKCHCSHVVHHDTPYLVWTVSGGNSEVAYHTSLYNNYLHAFTYAAPRYFFSIQGPPEM